MSIIARIMVSAAEGRLTQILMRRFMLMASRVVPISFQFLVEVGCLERPAHAYCIWHAAMLAQRLGYQEISVAEFGVAGGVTLLIAARYAKAIERATGIRIRVYGFDTGEGLPALEGVRDLPYWFRPKQYSMNSERLRAKVANAELIIGNVRDTVTKFFRTAKRPPIAAIFNDLDLFSSTRNALQIFNADNTNFLPRIFMYVDDVCGSPIEMYGPFNGELAAHEIFDREHGNIKIHLNQNLLPLSHLHWRYQIYYVHLFDHPKYSVYVGGGEQRTIEAALQLKS